ncbi:MAG: hypothetical protein ACR2IE_00305 [Candidatus Sumerlaeaceae bacterium]
MGISNEKGAQSGGTGACPQKRGIRARRRRRNLLVVGLFGIVALVVGALAITMRSMTGEPAPAAWLWNPEDYFSPAGRQRLVRVARKWKISAIFAQVHHNGLQLSQTAELQALIKQAAKKGIEIHALSGSPDWSDPKQLEMPLSLIDAVTSYNQHSPAKFAGVHFDIEPYLLPRWAIEREKVVENFLTVVSSIANRGREKRLHTGFSVPFFFGDDANFRDEKLPIFAHVMKRCDEVAVMAYRTRLSGSNGVERLTRPIRMAAVKQSHGASVRLGLELTTGTARRLLFVTGVGPPERPEELPYRYNGREVRLVHEGRVYLLGLESKGTTEAVVDAVVALAAQTRFPTTAEDEVLSRAVRELEATGEYGSVKARSLGTAFGKPLSGIECVEKLTTETTFAGRSAESIRSFVSRVNESLLQPPQVQGVIYHDFAALDRLTAR